ncbi:hypothetical protein ASE04_28580 [Rhizobium sp. Root708]|nr:hypothetical protein ASE04_28580 [Rhizobium sp. Root708]
MFRGKRLGIPAQEILIVWAAFIYCGANGYGQGISFSRFCIGADLDQFGLNRDDLKRPAGRSVTDERKDTR